MNEKGGIPPIEGGISSLQSRTHDQKLWEDQKGLVNGNTHGIYCSPNSYSEIWPMLKFLPTDRGMDRHPLLICC